MRRRGNCASGLDDTLSSVQHVPPRLRIPPQQTPRARASPQGSPVWIGVEPHVAALRVTDEDGAGGVLHGAVGTGPRPDCRIAGPIAAGRSRWHRSSRSSNSPAVQPPWQRLSTQVAPSGQQAPLQQSRPARTAHSRCRDCRCWRGRLTGLDRGTRHSCSNRPSGRCCRSRSGCLRTKGGGVTGRAADRGPTTPAVVGRAVRHDGAAKDGLVQERLTEVGVARLASTSGLFQVGLERLAPVSVARRKLVWLRLRNEKSVPDNCWFSKLHCARLFSGSGVQSPRRG